MLAATYTGLNTIRRYDHDDDDTEHGAQQSAALRQSDELPIGIGRPARIEPDRTNDRVEALT